MPNMSNMDLKYIEVAILMDVINKYEPRTAPFYLQSLTPGKSKTTQTSITSNADTSNLANTDTSIGSTNVTSGSTITLNVPTEYTLDYPVKYIPQGTRFLVSFIGGDLTKPVIVGRDYDDQN